MPTAHACAGQEAACDPPPSCNPATSVGEHTPFMVGAEPRSVGFRALPCAGQWGTNVCEVPTPRAGALMAAGTSFLSAQQYRCQQQGGVGGCPVLPMGQEITAGLSPRGQGNNAKQVVPAQGAAWGTSRLDAPCDRISSRDHFAMTELSPTLGKDGQHHSQAHPHLPKLLLPSKPHRHTASFMTEFTGTSCRVQGMLFLPPTPPPSQPCCLCGQESGLCVGQNCGQHVQVWARQSHGRETHANVAKLPPVMV